MPVRRFLPPWDIENNGACFIIRDAKRRHRFDEVVSHDVIGMFKTFCSKS
jgi:hypothetical protein